MTGVPDPLLVEHRQDPVSGWRANDVVIDATGARAWLKGVHHRRRYGVDTEAACSEFDHPAPASGCHCGLHCWPDRTQAEVYRRTYSQSVLCQVELLGEVVCHGDVEDDQVVVEGYRGARMRTLVVEFTPVCVRCARPADGLGAFSDRDADGPGDTSVVRAVCRKCHAPRRLTTGELAGMLGTEVRFGPPPPRRPFWKSQSSAPTVGLFGQAFTAGAAQPLLILVATLSLMGIVRGLVDGSPGAVAVSVGSLLGVVVTVLAVRLRWTSRPLGMVITTMVFCASAAALLIPLAVMPVPPRVLVPHVGARLPNDPEALTHTLRRTGLAGVVVDPPVDGVVTARYRDGRECVELTIDRISGHREIVAMYRTQVARSGPACPAPRLTPAPTP